ncbi:MAG: hypothetical protein WKG06_13920 [Segetibacter sp.]
MFEDLEPISDPAALKAADIASATEPGNGVEPFPTSAAAKTAALVIQVPPHLHLLNEPCNQLNE